MQREGAAAAESGDAEPVRASPPLLAGVIGGGADVAEVLRAGDPTRDLPHLGEVLALHPTLAEVQLG